MATTVAFRIGDVVRLRSGGPPMTVRGHFPDEMVLCQWFEHGVCCTEAFPAAMLEQKETPNVSVRRAATQGH